MKRIGFLRGLTTVLFVGCSLASASAQHTVASWGANNNGQLGNGTTMDSLSLGPVSGLTDVVAISASSNHTMALKSDGTVWTWGANYSGSQPGIPVQALGITGAVTIGAGEGFSAVLKSDGTVWTWGRNDNGELGRPSDWISVVPTQVPGLSNITALSVGWMHTLALKSDGTVWAWGFNLHGQLGIGEVTWSSETPVQVVGMSNVVALAAGESQSLALKSDGTVWAWGGNGWGQVGSGQSDQTVTLPVQIQGLPSVTKVFAGGVHSFAVGTEGTVWAWGKNDAGELGDGTTTQRSTPTLVQIPPEVTMIAPGRTHTLAVTSEGAAWVWGHNAFSWDNTEIAYSSLTPQPITGLAGVTAVATAYQSSFVLSSTPNAGSLYGTVFLTYPYTPQPFTFIFHPTDNSGDIVRVVKPGRYSGYFLSGIPANTYTVQVKRTQYLAKSFDITVATGGAVKIDPTLLVGDINDDNAVDIGDLLLLIAHYNQVEGVGDYLAAGDLSADGANDIDDLLLLIENYNKVGD